MTDLVDWIKMIEDKGFVDDGSNGGEASQKKPHPFCITSLLNPS